jgi:hypothetical protein
MEEGPLRDYEGVVAQVRMVEVTKGPKKLHFCNVLWQCGGFGTKFKGLFLKRMQVFAFL